MKFSRNTLYLLAGLLAAIVLAAESNDSPAPATDRVGLPKDYQRNFQVLRAFNKAEQQQVVTVFGNDRAASIKSISDVPYPYGSIIVMETSNALKDPHGKPLSDEKGIYRKDNVVGLHVMRREKNFGEAYAQNRTGEWEYVEYRADGTYITPPEKSFACAKCHVKAGPKRDFVYRGKFSSDSDK